MIIQRFLHAQVTAVFLWTALFVLGPLAQAVAQDLGGPPNDVNLLARIDCGIGTPPVPTNLRAEAVGEREITLAWDPSEYATGYSIARRGMTVGTISAMDAPWFTDNKLSPDSEYCYTVRASDGGGDSTATSAEFCIATRGFGWGCPQLTTVLDLENYVHASDTAVYGHHAYTADDYGLSIWEVSEPALPQHIASWVGPECEHITVNGSGTAYVANLDEVIVIDVEDPAAPFEISRLPQRDISAIEVSGDHLFVGSRDGLLVYFVGDATQPQLVGEYSDLPGYPGLHRVFALDIVGDLAYVTWEASIVTILDVSAPEAPALLGWTNGEKESVWGNGVLALVTGISTKWIDGSDPGNPVAYILPRPFINYLHDVVFDGDLAYMIGSAFRVVDISDYYDPVVLGEFSLWGGHRLEMINSTALLTRTSYGGFMALDVSDPGDPVLIGEAARTGYANRITLSGDLALQANGFAGWMLLDLGSPSKPALIAKIDTPGYARGIATSGTTAVVADDWKGLQIFDFSDPANPIQLAAFQTATSANDVAICGDLVAVAEGSMGDDAVGFEFVDVADPAHPVLVWAPEVDYDWAESVAASEKKFYLGTSSGLAIFDVSQPHQPYQVARLDVGHCHDVAVSGPLLVAATAEGFVLIDVSDPFRPSHISWWGVGLMARVGFEGTTAVVQTESTPGYAHHYILDLADPWKPIVSEYRTSRRSLGVVLRDGIIYAASNPFLEVFTLECGAPRRGSSRQAPERPWAPSFTGPPTTDRCSPAQDRSVTASVYQ